MTVWSVLFASLRFRFRSCFLDLRPENEQLRINQAIDDVSNDPRVCPMLVDEEWG